MKHAAFQLKPLLALFFFCCTATAQPEGNQPDVIQPKDAILFPIGHENIKNELDLQIKQRLLKTKHKRVDVWIAFGLPGLGKKEVFLSTIKKTIPSETVIQLDNSILKSMNVLELEKTIFSAIQANPKSIFLIDRFEDLNEDFRKSIIYMLEENQITTGQSRLPLNEALFLLPISMGGSLLNHHQRSIFKEIKELDQQLLELEAGTSSGESRTKVGFLRAGESKIITPNTPSTRPLGFKPSPDETASSNPTEPSIQQKKIQDLIQLLYSEMYSLSDSQSRTLLAEAMESRGFDARLPLKIATVVLPAFSPDQTEFASTAGHHLVKMLNEIATELNIKINPTQEYLNFIMSDLQNNWDLNTTYSHAKTAVEDHIEFLHVYITQYLNENQTANSIHLKVNANNSIEIVDCGVTLRGRKKNKKD